ncbi:SDR family NAD(P)-dependent oxidoreductase [Aquabacterium fontiphilum]|jgi:short-subunit dehydrogenase|uniref:SDR family oxidoreductase n=1 Tax=Aquabacterium fontiphilum TaxID=450365 RepID=UPI001376A628|nr:SDR family oxidoreductase [Aquabacterium fontiphilum]NBD20510.1 SDR family NAD(P)-dependent oxidoreductase [Aquabacterium fontiphilum]
MSVHLKPLHEQVIVITGASSGIGLATAEAAAEAGAKLVLVARSGETLESIVQRLQIAGARAISVVADVGRQADMQTVADTAISHFGCIDTWINDAGVSIFGRLEEVSDTDNRKLFDTNFWGVVYGSLAALPHLKRHGGALINLGSEVSDTVLPLQGMYSASKHAVKGFTDALRVEVEQLDKAPVSIVLIQPTAVNTPFPDNARNYLSVEPQLPTPQLDPREVAQAILKAATEGGRDITVGVMAKLNVAAARFMPSLSDRMAARQADRQQRDEPAQHSEGALYRASQRGQVFGRGASQH